MSRNDDEKFTNVVEFPARRNTGGNPPGGDQLEARIAKLESHFEYIRRDLDDVKSDVRDIKREMRDDFRVLFGSLILVALGLAGIMAKGFGWL